MAGGEQDLLQATHVRVTVEAADEGHRYRDFLDLPYRLHRDNPCWVPPLRAQQRAALEPARHPFYSRARRNLFVAYRAGQPVGRIAAILNPVHCETFEEKCTHFGFFESIDDAEVAAALFGAVEATARRWGHDRIRGPFSPNVNGELGLQIDAFDQPGFVMIPYNPPYYRKLVEGCGFEKDVDLYCYMIERDKAPQWLLKAGRRLVESSPFSFRKLSKADLPQETERIWEVYNAAWERNWLWTKSSRAEFQHLVGELIQIVDYDLVYLAEDAEGRLAGFSIALPNINEALIKVRNGRLWPFGFLKLLWYSRPGAIRSVRFIAMGVLEPHRQQGLHWGLVYLQVEAGLRKAYRRAEMSQILETNAEMIRVAEVAGGRRYKTHRMYVRMLDQN